MALPRDFEIPLASFVVDESDWTLTYKLGGKLFAYDQDHSPFDVVAWHVRGTIYLRFSNELE